MTMRLGPGKFLRNTCFIAQGPLVCIVESVRRGVAYCDVINGAWKIGFDIHTGECVAEGTDPRALPHALGARVLMFNPRGRDYNDKIAYAEGLGVI